MFCTNCGEQMQDGQAVCTKCGFAKDTGNKYCGNCGAEVQPQQAVCTQCGCVVNEAKREAEAKKASAGDQVGGQDKIVVILVAIPMVFAIGKEISIFLSFVVNSVEEVFLIIESYSVGFESLLC